MPISAGSNFGPYRIIEPLGRGGMASGYKAHETGLDRYVALKALPQELVNDAGFSTSFQREARIVAGLEHRHIVPIYNFGIDEGVPWMSMRLVQGGTAATLLKSGPLERARALTIRRKWPRLSTTPIRKACSIAT